MRKSKFIFAAIAVAVILLCVLCFVLFKDDSDNKTNGDHSLQDLFTKEPTELVTVDTEPYMPPATSEPIEITDSDILEFSHGENVTIRALRNDKSVPWDKTYNFTPQHPEYIKELDGNGNPFACNEGLIFRNNTEVTIHLAEKIKGGTLYEYDLTFGVINGECNRFIYLNPRGTVTLGDKTSPFTFYTHFFNVSDGTVLTINEPIPTETVVGSTRGNTYTIERTLDIRSKANYIDKQHPGAIWFTSSNSAKYVDLDFVVLRADGAFLAALHMGIIRNSDGTYQIDTITDRNLNIRDLEGNGPADDEPTMREFPQFTTSECDYLIELATETFNDPSKTHNYIFLQTMNGYQTFQPQDVIIDYFGAGEPFYYRQIIPGETRNEGHVTEYKHSGLPVVAVTLKARHGGIFDFTLYFQVVHRPSKGTHGIYYYIGRDYQWNLDAATLYDHGYRGSDLKYP